MRIATTAARMVILDDFVSKGGPVTLWDLGVERIMPMIAGSSYNLTSVCFPVIRGAGALTVWNLPKNEAAGVVDMGGGWFAKCVEIPQALTDGELIAKLATAEAELIAAAAKAAAAPAAETVPPAEEVKHAPKHEHDAKHESKHEEEDEHKKVSRR